MTRILFIFLDGVGIGGSADNNPFFAAKSAFLPFYTANNTGQRLPDGAPIKAIDATLGVDGLPQSATGQTSLFTGENIPAMVNGHKGSYPDKTMRRIIKEKNLLSRLRNKNLDARFINVYPFYAQLFTYPHIDIEADGSFLFSEKFPPLFKKRISVTTCMSIANRMTPFDETDIIRENALYQDYSNLSLIHSLEEAQKSGKLNGLLKDAAVPGQPPPTLPLFSPGKAAEILFKASQKYDFLLYEYFLTDVFGHRNTFAERVRLVRQLDRLVGRLISLLDKKRDTLLITSDHGNLEDGAALTHTRNPVPLVVWGNRSHELRENIHSLVDVTPALEKFFN
ncbi:MAG: sulfatase-like hydrolase/transferase [Candidatus Aminicenantes bacterium]|nr:sulfatase-like hydrolase/transferase [Candidatus Aminicenantes bacterium]